MEGKRLNATLTFGMVVIPVGVVPVLKSTDRISFKRLHKVCEQPVTQPLFCPHCEQSVDSHDVISGYQIGKGQFLVLSDEERASVAVERSSMIEITKFVRGTSVALMDSVRLGSDKSYWLPPQSDDVLTPYAVLAQGMRKQGVIGIAKATVWSRQWPVCIEVIDGMLALTQLHPASAVRQSDQELPPVKANQLSMACTVIDEYTSEFHMDDLVSDADVALKSLVEAKLMGAEFEAPEVAVPAPTLDIMDALKASVKKSRKKVAA